MTNDDTADEEFWLAMLSGEHARLDRQIRHALLLKSIHDFLAQAGFDDDGEAPRGTLQWDAESVRPVRVERR